MKLRKYNNLLIILLIIFPLISVAQAPAESAARAATAAPEATPAGRAVLGVNISVGQEQAGPVEGAAILGVTPGAAAEVAGLRAGDVLVAINDTSLTADSQRAANVRLLQFMSLVKPGQELRIAYLRAGQVNETTLVAEAFEPGMLPPDFPFRADLEKLGRRIETEFIVPLQFRWRHHGVFTGMELVTLTADLGRYFGTEEGLLVIRAPDSGDIDLEDGDVIQTIGARRPTGPDHAMRILRSYEPGEELVLQVIRQNQHREVRLTLPIQEQRTGWNRGPQWSSGFAA